MGAWSYCELVRVLRMDGRILKYIDRRVDWLVTQVGNVGGAWWVFLDI